MSGQGEWATDFPQEAPATELVNRVLANAARRANWPMSEHAEFVKGVATALGNATGQSIDLRLPEGAPQDPDFPRAPTLPCAIEAKPFLHAADVDAEPEEDKEPIIANEALIARARQICEGCPVKVPCLEYGTSPPKIKDGMYGGRTKVERQADFDRNFNERLKTLREMYQKIGTQALKGIDLSSTDTTTSVQRALLPLAPILKARKNRELDPALQLLVVNQQITDRAMLLLPPHGVEVLKAWMRAMSEGGNPFGYSFENKAERERLVEATLRGLSDGTFNYAWWVRNLSSMVQRTAITFLAMIGEPVPDGDIEYLKQVAFEYIQCLPGVVPRRWQIASSIRDLLVEFYGLGEEPAATTRELAEKHYITTSAIHQRLSSAINRIKRLLGNENKDEL